jgi:hypothetical protein
MALNAKRLRLDTPARHIFLCSDAEVPKCCSREASAASWDYLKRRMKVQVNMLVFH